MCVCALLLLSSVLWGGIIFFFVFRFLGPSFVPFLRQIVMKSAEFGDFIAGCRKVYEDREEGGGRGVWIWHYYEHVASSKMKMRLMVQRCPIEEKEQVLKSRTISSV